MRLGIQKKLTLYISGILIVIFALILWGFLYYSISSTRENIEKQQFAMTELIASSIDGKLGTYLATISDVAQELNSDHFANPEKAQVFLDGYRGLLSIFDNGMFLFDADYTLVAETPYLKGRRGIKSGSLMPFLKNVQKNDFPDISNPYLSKKSEVPAIAMAVPLRNSNGSFQGFLIGSINLTKDYFVEEILGYKIGNKGYLYLFNTERTMILHPDKTRIMKQDVPLGANKLFDKAIQGYEGSGETINSRGVPQIASFKRLKTVDWILASVYSQEEAYSPIRRMRAFLFAAAVLVTLLSIVLVWMLTSKITSSLNSFTDQVRNISEHPEGIHKIHIDSNDEITLLASTFNSFMHKLKLAHESLEELTRTDHLTGLFNRRHLELEAPKLISLSKRKNTSTAVVLIDIDHFKNINDTAGHEAGDMVLVGLAQILQNAVRPYDLLVRYGGEEFLVLLPLSSRQEAMEFAERIRRIIEDTPINIDHQELSLTVSIGVYVAEQILNLQEAISFADGALYKAKNNGRNQVCQAQDMPA
ncbi:MAG TPA: GGDEF domain-containing protein [Dongiaceae bacterium]|nr:GGDEF domain-containing protein [Dongiaceae bacterium]